MGREKLGVNNMNLNNWRVFDLSFVFLLDDPKTNANKK